MKKRHYLFLGLITAVVFSSCTTFTATGLSQGVTPGGGPAVVVGRFTEREWVNKFLGSSGGTNLFNISSRATDGVIIRTIQKNLRKYGGSGVINLEIKHVNNPFQWIINKLTLFIWAPSTVVITGTVIMQ